MIKIECSYQKKVNLKDLIPHPKNPNQHPQKQIELLAELIRFHGWRTPITVSKLSGFIVRGHGRYYAALELNEKYAPVDFQDYDSEEKELADLAADNRIAELANKDDDLLKSLLEKVNKSKINLEVTSYTRRDLDKLIEKIKKKEEKPEVEFSEELHESSNYIVLYFNNDIDWLQALTLFELKTVKALDSKPGYEKQGIGRVINGVEAINKLLKE